MMKRILCIALALAAVLGLLVQAPTTYAASSMKASDDLVNLIKRFEGFSATPYVDSDGKYTIGYGTRCPDDMVDYYNENPMSKEEAEAELRRVLVTYENETNRFIDRHSLTYEQKQFDAVISLIYNVGGNWLYTGETLIKALTTECSDDEVMFAFSLYSMSGGKRSRGHVLRRLAEANLFLEGNYSGTAAERYCFVLYDGCGGTVEEYNVQGFDGDLTVPIRSTAVREGYTFLGWYTEKTGGDKVTELDKSLNDTTLYAQWEPEPGVTPDPTDPTGTTGTPETSEPSEPTTAPTEPSIPGGTPIDPVQVTVTGSVVNLRKGPGLSYSTVDQVYKGQKLTVTAVYENDNYTWGATTRGWIALEFTDYGQEPTVPTDPTDPPTEPTDPTTEPTEPPTTVKPTDPPATEKPTDPPTDPTTEPTDPPTQPTQPPEPIPEGERIDPLKITVTATAVNLRQGPGTKYVSVDQLFRGEQATVTALYDDGIYLWGKTSRGWLALEYTNYDLLIDPPEDPEVPPTEAPTDPTTEPSEPTEPEEPTLPEEGTVQVFATVIATSSQRLWSAPGGTVSGLLEPGDRVQILEQKEVDGVSWGRCGQGWLRLLSHIKLETVVQAEPSAQTASAMEIDVYIQVTEEAGTNVYSAPESTLSGKLRQTDRVLAMEWRICEDVLWVRCVDGWVPLLDQVQVQTVARAADPAAANVCCRTIVIDPEKLTVYSQPGSDTAAVCHVLPGTVLAVREWKPVDGIIWARTDLGWLPTDQI